MKIAIIGAGFTGLSAAYYLTKQGHEVTVFEKDPHPGGLAVGYQEKAWEWTLEKHYHHWFTNDAAVLELAREIGHPVLIKRPKTSVYVNGKIYQFDSPKEVLLFPELSFIDRFRMAAVVGLLRYNPFWKPLEKINASTFLPKAMGEKAYKMIWEPQFRNKFGEFARDVSLAWFWARITKRTPSLAYPEGGFLAFANHLVKVIKQQGGTVLFNNELIAITNEKKTSLQVKSNNKTTSYTFDKVIFTLPTFLFMKTAPQLPKNYTQKMVRLKGLGATNLVLRLKKPFFRNNTYWLSVCDTNSPVMAIVEHTNYMDKSHYDNEHIVYLGNYLPPTHPEFLMTKEEKLKLFDPFLRKINPDYKKNLIGYELFKAPFAQPVIPTNYSRMIPSMKTPLPNVYLANIEQVYPWDRGTNYAVALGKKVAKLIDS
ncbi:MAG TPA: NAD(P)/FAD-dependent oxidoreductase [Methylomirabilota bacterium]|nr:NAD(P)/FAD-dependent oxidoreductase [Methylomirabilota bacterium]